jgi:esterase/lipase superfamily enzyme
MKKEFRNWHGKEIELRIHEVDNRFGCEVLLCVENQEFHGSTVSFYEWGMCRFDTIDAAIKAAITDMENRITSIASNSFIEKHREFFNTQDKHHKIARWLKNNVMI